MLKRLGIAFGILALAVGGVNGVNAQDDVQTGIRIGYGFSTFSGDDVTEAGFRSGWSASGLARINFTETFGVQGELGVSLKGASEDVVISHNEYKSIEITYLEAPLLFVSSLNLGESVGASLFAGPTIGVSLGDTWTAQEDAVNNQFSEEVHSIQAEVTVGVGLQVRSVLLDARYGFGLTKPLVFSNARSKNISFSIGYMF